MRINSIHTINQTTPNFKARFTTKDIKILMNSAKDEALFTQNFMRRGAKALDTKRIKLSGKTLYGKLKAILDHVDTLKGKQVSLLEEKVQGSNTIFKIINDNNEVLGTGARPIIALDNAFVIRTRFELAPEYWGDKLPVRLLMGNAKKLGEITPQDILSKALN